MLPYIVRRLLASLPVVAVVLLIVFFVVRLVPGDPATLIAGHEATPEEYQKIKKSLGLDKSVGVQFPRVVHRTHTRRLRRLDTLGKKRPQSHFTQA